ncbi:MAG: transcription-repair coupling factor [Chloroflexi bacterium]|nr:transcription-repair coupling factor [Chloroflexota bacterium]
MEYILQQLRSTPEYATLLRVMQENGRQSNLGLARAARLPVLSAIYEDINRPILILTDRADHALAVFDELGFWLPSAARYLFTEPNPLFYEDAAWGNTTRRERLQALTVLASYHLPFAQKPATPPIIVASARAVMTRTLPRREFLKASKNLVVGQEIQPDTLIHQWSDVGYQHAEIVVEPGQFSRRGGILDIWVTADALPARLDFFGDEIETIRRFDPATQRTVAKLESLLITPAREYILNSQVSDLLPSNGELSEFFIPVLHQYSASILDYLPPRGLVIIDDLSLSEAMVTEVEEQAVKFRQESIGEGTLSENFPVPYLAWSEVLDSIHSHPYLELGQGNQVLDDHSIRDLFGHDQRFGGRLKPFVEYLASITSQGDRVVIVSRQRERLEELWLEHRRNQIEVVGGLPGPEILIQFVEASLSEGWVLAPESNSPVHLITDSEIFGWERPVQRSTRQSAARGAEAPESAFADLRPGDFVVHIDYGIGRFMGLVRRVLDNHEREFLVVEYDGGDQVFVPVFQADRLNRYIGTEGGLPNVTRLGTAEWANAKSSVKEAVQKVAEELLDLYAKRQTISGYAFQPDTQWQKELEDSFAYVETPDQVSAIAAIKRDMETARPMDRLLCGDVGYGKTEVALRAAFKAVQDGKQVALLVPTTVLAQQHFETFQQRLAAFPVVVEMLSRFRTQREQNEIIRKLLLGQVDIIIGTHRLISQDVEFKDLGLVIIDEEQRFGVTHKEHLKKLRTEVDVLTLTATPIPRTLYMALTGVRDISNLNTPPEERLPIITHVGPYSPKLVRQAVLRELERGGQIFFVHNRVQTIHAMKMHLQMLVPEARIGIGHGQLDEKELASVMHQFTDGQIDILLSTTIIESGLDIPNANTLIIDRADTFGLAQLYQLRGRVGRAASRAYAYFFRHRKKVPTIEGQERLDVIAENTQLGAGYSIAMRDLEIRGAGELLGMRQSGHISSVGFHLYTRMLATEVKKLRRAMIALADGNTDNVQIYSIIPAGGPFSSFEDEIKEPVTVDLPLAIGIPVSYIPNQDLRLRLYRRIASLRVESELEPLMAEFVDRFGPLPEMFQNLFFQMRVKLAADAAGLLSVSTESGQIVLRYPALTENMSQRMLSDLGSSIRGGKNAYWCNFLADNAWQDRLVDLLDRLKAKVITLSTDEKPSTYSL